jgi:hypothetical protein
MRSEWIWGTDFEKADDSEWGLQFMSEITFQESSAIRVCAERSQTWWVHYIAISSLPPHLAWILFREHLHSLCKIHPRWEEMFLRWPLEAADVRPWRLPWIIPNLHLPRRVSTNHPHANVHMGASICFGWRLSCNVFLPCRLTHSLGHNSVMCKHDFIKFWRTWDSDVT